MGWDGRKEGRKERGRKEDWGGEKERKDKRQQEINSKLRCP